MSLLEDKDEFKHASWECADCHWMGSRQEVSSDKASGFSRFTYRCPECGSHRVLHNLLHPA